MYLITNISMVYDYPHSGKTLEECRELLRRDFESSRAYNFKTIAYALESLRNTPGDMREYLDALSELAAEGLRKMIEEGTDLNPQAASVANGTVPLGDMARHLARGQLVHVIGIYIGSDLPRIWNDAISELKIPTELLI